jgi:benzil reductase ((S)-benzoin forming)
MKSLHIITGVSRGLGRAMAENLLAQGDHVIGLGRSQTWTAPNLVQKTLDLAQPSLLEDVVDQIFSEIKIGDFEAITLTHNSGQVGPVGESQNLTPASLFENFTVNLVAPAILTSQFLKRTENFKGRRMILYVSSGVAQFPKATWAAYSSAKAGLEAFARAVRDEGPQGKNPVRQVIFNPGVIDTEMQRVIREETEFPDRHKFVAMKKQGQLQPPVAVAGVAVKVLKEQISVGKDEVSVGDFL